MSEKETSWILSLKDKISQPIKGIISTVKESTQVIDKNTDRVVFNEKQTKEALVNSKKYYKDLQQQIKENEKEVKELQKAYDKAAPGTSQLAAKKPLEAAKRSLQELRESLKGAKEDIKSFEDDLGKAADKKEKRQGFMTDINQTMEVIDRVSSMFDFAEPIRNTRVEIQRMTQVSGEELDKLTSKVHNIGSVFNENDQDIARAAHSMQSTWGGSYNSMLSLLQKGYEKGADINNEMLDSMKEYPKQLKEAGLSASESIALIAQANKQGIYSDKAIDSIKELNLALREMDKPQIEALQGIGISAKDLQGKTTFDVAKLISEKMQGASSHVQQKVLADIFKAAGEDAGKEFVLGLASIDLNIDNIPSIKQAGAGIKGVLADIRSFTANTFGGAIPYIQAFGQAGSGVVGIISLFKTLSEVTAIQTLRIKTATIAQKLWNVAMTNPVNAAIAGIAAIGGAVYGLTQMVKDNTTVNLKSIALSELQQSIDKKVIQNTAEKTTKLKVLTEVAANEKLGLEARKRAMNELINIDSRYKQALQGDIILTEELRKTTAKLTEEIWENARVRAMEETLVEKEKENINAAYEKKNNKYEKLSFIDKFQDGINDMLTGESEWRKKKNAEEILVKNPIQMKQLTKEIAEHYQKKQPKKDEETETGAPTLDNSYFRLFNESNKKGGKRRFGDSGKSGLNISGGSGSGSSKTITMNLNITNHFSRTGNSEDRSFADRIITQINDGLRDAVATI